MAGYSFSGYAPVTNINGFTDNSFLITDGLVAPVLITLNVSGKITGALIATELQYRINLGFASAGSLTTVRVSYTGIQYRIYSLSSATMSMIIIMNASSNNIADNLKLGVINGGTEGFGSYSLVDSPEYRFEYNYLRYLRFNYLLERNGVYEVGELSVIHDLVITETPGDEVIPTPIVSPFTPPNISTYQSVSIGSRESLGVIFSFIHDVSTTGGEAKFGLAFRITNELPAVYPKLIASYITAYPPADI
jgi:hypothetical protein